jgi:hypothetical protein
MSLNFLHFDILLQNAVFFAVISNLGGNVNWMILYKVYILHRNKRPKGDKKGVFCLFVCDVFILSTNFFPGTFLIKFSLYSMSIDFVFLTFSDIGITMVL